MSKIIKKISSGPFASILASTIGNTFKKFESISDVFIRFHLYPPVNLKVLFPFLKSTPSNVSRLNLEVSINLKILFKEFKSND